MLIHPFLVVALAAVLISCSTEREWRDSNTILTRSTADEPANPAEPNSKPAKADRPGTLSEATDDDSEEANASGPFGQPLAPNSGPAAATPAAGRSAWIDPHVLFEETRPLSLDVRLPLSALSVSAEGSAQRM